MKSNKIVKFFKDKAPDILIGVGIVGTVTGTVMACKATKNSGEIVKEHKNKLADIKEAKEIGMSDINSGVPVKYDEKQYKRDLTVTYFSTAGKFIKLYLPSALVMTASIGCLLGSHRILNARNAALTATCATLDSAYKNYRANVVEKYGEDIDKQMANGVTPVKAKEGESKSYKADEKAHSDPYSVIFDKSTTSCWEDDPNYAEGFLAATRDWFIGKYERDREDIFLNEIKKRLGIDPDKFGQLNGIKWDKNIESKIPFEYHKIIDPATKEYRGFLVEFKNVEYIFSNLPEEV